jgi:hypothetical protein
VIRSRGTGTERHVACMADMIELTTFWVKKKKSRTTLLGEILYNIKG